MKLSIIAGIGKNNELGKNNTLLWHLPADLVYFKKITTGHTVVMGRKTFESIGRPLPNRRNIVITSDKNYKKEEKEKIGIEISSLLENAISLSRSDLDSEIFIIGGAQIYEQAMNYADKLYITHIEAEDENANTFFPVIDKNIWREISREDHKKDERNPYNYAFVVYERLK